MLRELNTTPELSRWTHRAPDDPGIALLESAAVVADILTFYQEHYANEAFLRTAAWRESIQELVRLTGYRLVPGIGGRATFAFEVKGTVPVRVPSEFPLTAELEKGSEPFDFLTTEELLAFLHLSRFRLYRQRFASGGLSAQVAKFEITAIDGAQDPTTLAAFDLKKGDKLILVAPPPAWLTSGTTISDQKAAQLVKVSKVIHQLGRLIVEIEGSIEESWPAPVTAYRVGRSFRHFGHNTPAKTTFQNDASGSMVTQQYDAHVTRHIKWNCSGQPFHLYTELPTNYIPLDQEANDLSTGGTVLIEAVIVPSSTSATPRRVTVAHTIRGLRALTMSWGNVSGPSTWIDLGVGTPIVPNSSIYGTTADIREFRIHEATSPALTLRDVAYHLGGDIGTAAELFFYGTKTEAEPLVGRRVFLRAADGRNAGGVVAAVDTAVPEYARMRQVTLDKKPKGFQRSDFDEIQPTVDVFGNLSDATQGKRESEVSLGNGDARQVFQTFKIPKAPLTYLLDPTATPSHVPELALFVNGREWTRVDSFFGRGGTDEVYIVREDAKGESYVQFGDGEMGVRLPSGINNVVARYRTGKGALGPSKQGSKPSAGTRLEGLDKVAFAGEATGGAEPEVGEKARIAGPGKLQSLGRLVSLLDYETETLQVGGVIAATASWGLVDAVPTIQLLVLLEQAQQSDEQFAAVENVIRTADRAHGPRRHPLRVTQCELRYLYLTLTFAPDAALVPAEVEEAIRAALGLAGVQESERTGLFGLRRRGLGEKEYASRVEGVVQNIRGVVWCRVDALGLLPAGNDPTALTLPGSPEKHAQISCASTELLQLHPLHLKLLPTNP
jgi:hypothetical protein